MQSEEQQAFIELPGSVMIFGCGYIGSALAQALLEREVRVGALTRNAAKAGALRALGLDPVICADLHGDSWHAGLEASFDAVVNCVSSGGGGVGGYRTSYLEGQRSVNRWAEGKNVRTAIFTSSTSVYPQKGGVRVNESSNTADAPETGQLILDAEAELIGAEELFERRFVLRLAGIYGPGRHYLLDQLKSGLSELPGRGDHVLNLAHRDDIVQALLLCLGAPDEVPDGIYNVADGNPESKEALVRWLAGEIGVGMPVFNPDAASRRILFGGKRPPDRIIDSRKAREFLGWEPAYPSFRDGYRQILGIRENL